ncbi:Deoxyribonuclease-2-alpha [Trichinella zimbabwensis]|uniref:Deoxyribonuclease-2-alpha n=1 Tax=Trichinella zimbabwensis TaxID=268475 RepID=A0A0V1HBL8_9BILA|nr:Deoxyribonuclease-2-alpha [Trichinella zimbabwensis]
MESKWMLIFLLILPNSITATSTCQTQNGALVMENYYISFTVSFHRAILYKAAGKNDGRIITATNAAWQQSPAPIGNGAGNSFGKALEHVAAVNPNAKFVAYNNKPPNAVGVQTNSNSKGILIMDPTATDSAAWIIHTVPGFPKALQAYTFPAEEIAKGHLFLCFTIKEEQLDKSQRKEPALAVCIDDATIFTRFNDLWMLIFLLILPKQITPTSKCQTHDGAGETDWAVLYKAAASAAWRQSPAAITLAAGNSFGKALEHVAAADVSAKFVAYNNKPPNTVGVQTNSNSKALALRIARPLVYHHDIPAAEVNSRPNLKNLLNGDSSVLPPLTISKEIKTAADPGIKATVFSKGEKSGYEMFKRVLSRKLKKDLKVWTTRDTKLKSDCRILGRNIKLITSPISVSGDASTLENDVSQWAVTEPGNIFCAIDKPYHKSQRKEPALAVCIDDATIFTRFNDLVTVTEHNKHLLSNFQFVEKQLASTLENDVSQWAVTEPGNIFCAIDKPYHKSQRKEPALAVCIDDATIFTRFNDLVTGTDACN